MSLAIGVDVGGTKVSVAVLEGTELSEPTLRPTVLASSEGHHYKHGILALILAALCLIGANFARRPQA